MPTNKPAYDDAAGAAAQQTRVLLAAKDLFRKTGMLSGTEDSIRAAEVLLETTDFAGERVIDTTSRIEGVPVAPTLDNA